MKISMIKYVCCVFICVACTHSPAGDVIEAEDEIFKRAREITVAKTSLINAPHITLADGDHVFPRLSPDGNSLVYANSIVRNGTEGTAIYKLDLKKKLTQPLLNESQADKYKTYKAYILSLEWDQQPSITASLSDGDVDATNFTFDSITGRIVSEEFDSGDKWFLPASLIPIRDKIINSFPEWDEEVLNNALHQHSSIIPDRGVILQKNYSGHDHDIWFINTNNTKQSKILSLSKKDNHAFGGAVTIGNDIIFAVSKASGSYLFLLTKNGAVKPLAHYAKQTWRTSLRIKYTSPTEGIFMLILNEAYAIGNNPVFIFSSEPGLREATDFQNYYDADVSSDGSLIATSYWVGNKRHISVARRKK